MKKRFYLIALIAVLFFGCNSTDKADDFEVKVSYLNNGIPLYNIETDVFRTEIVTIIVEGGAIEIPLENEGLESILFNTMTMGSKNYPYDELQSIKFNDSTFINFYSDYTYSSLSLSCIDYNLKKALPVLSDVFMNPSFDEKYFDLAIKGMYQTIQNNENDSMSNLKYITVKNLYENTPLAASPSSTSKSIQNIDIDKLKKRYSEILDAKRISIVAAGSAKSSYLLKELNKTFGSIEKKNWEKKSFNKVTIKHEKPFINTLENASGTGYLLNTFTSPSSVSDDFYAYNIGKLIFSDLLHNIVREKYGNCYSVGITRISNDLSPANGLLVYRCSDMKNVSKRITEAERMFSEDKIIADKDSNGNYITSSIEERLDSYKNSLINSIYESKQTLNSYVSDVITKIIMDRDVFEKDTAIEKIRAVTADDVKKAFNKWYFENEKRWFIVTDENGKKNFVE